MFVIAIALSVLVGISLGLLGGGGSILMVPILRYVVGLETHRAIALSLLVVGTTSLAAIIPHARRGKVRWRTGVVFGIAGMIGAYVAGRFAKFVPASVLSIGFGAMMFATAAAMLRGGPMRSAPAQPGELPLLKVLAEGLIVGAVTGLVGAGGGFLVVPALVLLGGLSMDAAVATSLLVITMKSFAGLVGFAGHTPIDWTVAIAVTSAAVFGSVAGSTLAGRVRPDALRGGFGWFVLAMAFFVLAQEVPPLAGYAPNLLVAVVVSLVGTGLMAGIRAVARDRLPASDPTVPRRSRGPSSVAPPSSLMVGTARETEVGRT